MQLLRDFYAIAKTLSPHIYALPYEEGGAASWYNYIVSANSQSSCWPSIQGRPFRDPGNRYLSTCSRPCVQIWEHLVHAGNSQVPSSNVEECGRQRTWPFQGLLCPKMYGNSILLIDSVLPYKWLLIFVYRAVCTVDVSFLVIYGRLDSLVHLSPVWFLR